MRKLIATAIFLVGLGLTYLGIQVLYFYPLIFIIENIQGIVRSTASDIALRIVMICPFGFLASYIGFILCLTGMRIFRVKKDAYRQMVDSGDLSKFPWQSKSMHSIFKNKQQP